MPVACPYRIGGVCGYVDIVDSQLLLMQENATTVTAKDTRQTDRQTDKTDKTRKTHRRDMKIAYQVTRYLYETRDNNRVHIPGTKNTKSKCSYYYVSVLVF